MYPMSLCRGPTGRTDKQSCNLPIKRRKSK